jgi:hypothetical protein
MGFLESVEYRRIDNADDLEDIARLRYKAFTMVGLARENAKAHLIDDLDFKPNAHVMGIFFDEQLVSTIRVHHVTDAQRDGVATARFPDIMHPLLDAGKTFIDPVRFAADPEIMREYPALPYLTLRVATMATVYFDVDYCLSVIMPSHRAFYKRVFVHLRWRRRDTLSSTSTTSNCTQPMRMSSSGPFLIATRFSTLSQVNAE